MIHIEGKHMIDIHPPRHNKDRINEIISEITDASLNDRPTYKKLLANEKTFQRMHAAYKEMFDRQMEFPFC